MTFARRQNRLTTNFSERISYVKRRMTTRIASRCNDRNAYARSASFANPAQRPATELMRHYVSKVYGVVASMYRLPFRFTTVCSAWLSQKPAGIFSKL